jgi:putative RecB family exonuclease
MSPEQADKLKDFREDLHISHSQIFTYLNCSLKYYFSYVEGRTPEHRPAAMLFGSAIHAAIARYYKGVQKKGKPEPLSLLQDLFHDYWNWQVEDTGIPIAYKEGQNKDNMLNEGQLLVKTFCESAQPMEVIGVEEPYSSVLYDEEGNPTDFKLVGIVDCIQRDKDGKMIIIDNKTANRAYSKDKIEQDLQMTVYSYLAASSGLVPAKSETLHRFDVLLKLKKPRLDIYYTTRSAADRRRLAKIINQVLRGIEAGVFFPNPSWMCSDCQYAQACVKWSA